MTMLHSNVLCPENMAIARNTNATATGNGSDCCRAECAQQGMGPKLSTGAVNAKLMLPSPMETVTQT